VKGHSTILEQLEDRISELKDKIEIKEKYIVKLESCERSVQEFSDSTKRPNLRIMGIEEEEMQAKGIVIYSIK
jgi:hypothetical protein